MLPTDRYDNIDYVDHGGMALVWRARRKSTGRTVAVRGICGGPGGIEQIASEWRGAQIQRALCDIDRRVPKVYDVFRSTAGWLYVEMEFIEGEDLASVLARGPLAPPEAVRIAIEMFDFLRVAHSASVAIDGEVRRGQVHGDISARNVRIAENTGGVKILDFGIAKGLRTAATTVTFGNYAYISPERALSGRMGVHDDYWAAGVLLYEMLAGRRPFTGTREEVLAALTSHRAPPPLVEAVPRPLRLIISKLLAVDIADRYPTAKAVLEDLVAFRDGRRTRAEIEGESARTRPIALAARPAVTVSPQTRPLPQPRRAPVLPSATHKRRSGLRWFVFLLVVVIAAHIGIRERSVWEQAGARASADSVAHSSPEDLWRDLEALRRQSWLDIPTWRLGRVVAERLMSEAQSILTEYRDDSPRLREPEFQAAHVLLTRVLQIAPDDSASQAWLRYTEGHLARMAGEAAPPSERRTRLMQAVAHFEAAARLAPHLPDPYLGLARIYTFGMRDAEGARRALRAAEQRGQPLGRRGHAQLGTLAELDGRELLDQARQLRDLADEEPILMRARTQLVEALGHYVQAHGFGQTNRDMKRVTDWLRAIDRRLAEIGTRRAEARW